MATDAQTLLAQAACYQCYTANGYSARLLELALLRQQLLALNPMADTSPQTLLDQAKCYQCYAANPYALQLFELALLAQIVANGGSGGGAQLVVYTGASPTADGLTPTDPTKPAVAYKKDGTGPMFGWNTTTLAWD